MHEIKVLLRIEFKRMLKNKALYVSLFIGIGLAIGAFIESAVPHMNVLYGFTGQAASYPFSVFNSWMGVHMGLEPFATAYLYVCMLLAALPYCGFFAKDNHNQYILQYYSRASKNKVHMAKFITTFVSGGMIVLIPVLLNLIAVMMAVPALRPVENGLFIQSGSTIMGDLFYSHPFVFTFVYMWQFFLYGGAFSLVSLAVSFAFDNSFLVVISPFVTFYGIGVISTLCRNLFNTFTFSPMALLAPSLILKDEGLFAFVSEPLIVAVVSCVVFFIKGAENEVL